MSCIRPSILDGVALATLQTRLTQMQQTYLDLMSGAKIATASYAQADGNRSVTYTQANIADLVQAIIGVQTQIDLLTGIPCNRRPPVVPFFCARLLIPLWA